MSPTPPRVTRNRIDWAGLGWLFLFFWFFSGITQLLLRPPATAVSPVSATPWC
ncbi:hypothetical protein P4133_13265 [Pseudomonas aeruginosa]|nr:hypothetical protein [Pseudomonas aeruginosa]